MTYKAGNWVQLAGVSDDKLREIAKAYLKDNYASVGATEAQHNGAWTVINQENDTTSPRKIGSRIARIEAMRSNALKAEGADTASINKSYDLAIAYWGMRQELINERKEATELAQSGSESENKYTLPSLSGRMRRFSSGSGMYNAGGGGAAPIPAGEWRSLADTSAKKQQDEATAQRRAAMSPLDAAIDEAPAGYRRKIRELINNSLDKSRAGSVTDPAIKLSRLHSDLETEDNRENVWTGDSYADIAQRWVRKAQEIAAERGTDVFTKPSTQPAPTQQAEAKADANRVPLHGSPTNYYGQTLSTAADKARNNAFVAISSVLLQDDKGNSVGLDRERIRTILSGIEVKLQYSNAELRNLHDQAAAATDPNEQKAILAAMAVLTLENRFAELRAQDKKWNMFADNASVVAFVEQSAANAASYAVDDQTVGAAPAAGGAGASKGFRKVYGRKDGSMPVPPEDEVPTFTDAEQVKELQRSLGLTGAEVDGMYGPVTHAAMKAKAAQQNKQPKEFDFTLEGIFSAFIQWLTGGSTGTGQAAGGAGATTETTTPPDLTAQLATQLAEVASISDTVVDYRKQGIITLSDETVLSAFLDKFKDDKGVSSLTPEQIATITVSNGVISSQLIGQVETALGMTSDNKMDARLEAALNNATVKSAVVAAFTGTAVSGGATTDVASAGGAGAGGGQGAARQ